MMDADNESSILSALLSLKHGGNFAQVNSTNDQCDNYTTISGHSDEVLLIEPVGNNTSSVTQKSKKTKKRKLPSAGNAEGDPQHLKSFNSGNMHIKLMRGRYKCSLCGAFKTNHVCALVPDKLMCSVGVQSGPHSQETCEAVMHAVVSCDEDTSTSTKVTSSLNAISSSLDSMDGTHPAILTSSISNSNISGASNSNTTTSKLLTSCLMSGTETLYDKVYSEGIKPESTMNEGGISTPPTTTSTTSSCALQPPLVSLISTHGIFRERIITVSRNRPSIQDTTPAPTITTPDTPATTTPTSALPTAEVSSNDVSKEESVMSKQESHSTEQQPVLLSGIVSGLISSNQDARFDAAMNAAAQSLKLPHQPPSAFLCPVPASPSSLLSPKMLLMKQEYTKHHLVEQESEHDTVQSQLLLSSDVHNASDKEERFHGRAVSIADGDISDSKVKGYYKHHQVKAMFMQQKHQQI